MRRRWVAGGPVKGGCSLFAGPNSHSQPLGGQTMTKAQEIYDKVEALVATGMSKAESFKKLAAEYQQPVNSLRGRYYSFTNGKIGNSSRSSRQETTPEHAIGDARAALERSIAAIDREVETAEERAREAAGEAKSLKASAAERKQAIEAK